MKKILSFILCVAVLVGVAIGGHYVYKSLASRSNSSIVEIFTEI